ncbi:MAG: bifunctional phosphoribosyl-AMP cyclohydrolase/phosphoribosyl-ATP diphosphatase HisIE, partial [Gemmatimonadota bacterium]
MSGSDRSTRSGRGPEPDRRIRSGDDLDDLDFEKQDGLVAVVVQDAATREVLMVAWADRKALEETLRTGEMHFWSRSRAELWRKGETSGNVQKVHSLHADCDADTVLALVDPAGPACHTGHRTCFGAKGVASEGVAASDPVTAGPGRGSERASRSGDGDASIGPVPGPEAVLRELWGVLEERRLERPDGSYTTRLLDDENLRLKKLGEETTELVVSLTRSEKERIPEEAADLVYHLLVALLA